MLCKYFSFHSPSIITLQVDFGLLLLLFFVYWWLFSCLRGVLFPEKKAKTLETKKSKEEISLINIF